MTIASTRLLDYTKAVLFDLDGTLLDTARDLVNALEMVCAEEGHPGPDKQLAAQNVSNGAIGMVRVTFPNLDAANHERLRARLVAIYEQNLVVYTVPYPGVLETLDQLATAGVRWGVVTNKLKYLAVPILEQVGLLDRCAIVVGGDTAARNKPHPDPIQLAMHEMGVTPEHVAYVGDAEKDVLAGKAAGTRTIAVTWGYIVPDTDPYQWNADYTIEHPEQLINL
jgi:2-phosphoglycolate phosphatase